MRLLIVEDDHKIALFVKIGLKEAGFAVDHAIDGIDGLHLALTEPYDIAVIDIMLPKVDGLTIIKEMRETFKGKKFLVAVAGGITPQTAPEALANGADIIIVGRYITQSKDVERATREFLKSTQEMTHDIDLFRVHVE